MRRSAATLGAALFCAMLLAAPERASAGWLTITNSTKTELVVQDAETAARLVKRPKSMRLLPGEVYREFQPGEGKKTILVFDPRVPNRPLCKGSVAWTTDDVSLILEQDGSTVRLVRPALVKTAVPPSR